MIRRDTTLGDGTAAWLLISQVEHARISGELTRAWHESSSKEVIDAITHHDDGWREWESSPQLDSQRGRPLSFLEMPIAEAIEIWQRSIAAARAISPLAGVIVAGHFIGLASGSEHRFLEPVAQSWLREMGAQRTSWLREWQNQSPTHTSELADRDQEMLLTADLLSLWLCCDGPVAAADSATIPNAEMQSRTSTVLGKYCFTTHDKFAVDGEFAWRGSLDPWPFAAQELNLETPALAVPAAKYESWPKVATAGRPVRLRWQLRETLPPEGEC